MSLKFLKISFVFLALFLLNGCLQSTALLTPGVTIITTGNIPQAGFQFAANKSIKDKTGKDALTLVKEVVEKDHKKRKFNKEFTTLVERRVLNVRKKIDLN